MNEITWKEDSAYNLQKVMEVLSKISDEGTFTFDPATQQMRLILMTPNKTAVGLLIKENLENFDSPLEVSANLNDLSNMLKVLKKYDREVSIAFKPTAIEIAFASEDDNVSITKTLFALDLEQSDLEAIVKALLEFDWVSTLTLSGDHIKDIFKEVTALSKDARVDLTIKDDKIQFHSKDKEGHISYSFHPEQTIQSEIPEGKTLTISFNAELFFEPVKPILDIADDFSLSMLPEHPLKAHFDLDYLFNDLTFTLFVAPMEDEYDEFEEDEDLDEFFEKEEPEVEVKEEPKQEVIDINRDFALELISKYDYEKVDHDYDLYFYPKGEDKYWIMASYHDTSPKIAELRKGDYFWNIEIIPIFSRDVDVLLKYKVVIQHGSKDWEKPKKVVSGTFDTEEKAIKKMDDLIMEKVKKGYEDDTPPKRILKFSAYRSIWNDILNDLTDLSFANEPTIQTEFLDDFKDEKGIYYLKDVYVETTSDDRTFYYGHIYTKEGNDLVYIARFHAVPARNKEDLLDKLFLKKLLDKLNPYYTIRYSSRKLKK